MLFANHKRLGTRKKELAASGVIQRRARVLHARSEIHRAREERERCQAAMEPNLPVFLRSYAYEECERGRLRWNPWRPERGPARP